MTYTAARIATIFLAIALLIAAGIAHTIRNTKWIIAFAIVYFAVKSYMYGR
jgi:hypothetical protein